MILHSTATESLTSADGTLTILAGGDLELDNDRYYDDADYREAVNSVWFGEGDPETGGYCRNQAWITVDDPPFGFPFGSSHISPSTGITEILGPHDHLSEPWQAAELRRDLRDADPDKTGHVFIAVHPDLLRYIEPHHEHVGHHRTKRHLAKIRVGRK